MKNEKKRLFHPLACCAILSVATFSGIGIAAITGQLSVASGTVELFRSSSEPNKPEVLAQQLPVPVAKPTHVGLTRKAVNTTDENGKPMILRVGQRFSQTLTPACGRCGVIQSIERHDLQMPSNQAHDGTSETTVDNNAASVRTLPASMLARSSRNVFDSSGRKYEGATSFIVRLRMEDGSIRTIYEHQHPKFSVGEKVQLLNGAVVSLG